jgi:transcriptional regulator GlxA family with amidase domain
MRIALLAVDGLFDSGLTAVLDILATANALRAETGVEAAFHVVPVGVGDSVTTHHGMRLAVTPLAEVAEALDLVIMSAVGFRPPDQVIDAVRGHAVLEWVTSFHNQGIPLAAACSGTFFLAEAGVLDGVTATTSWWLGRAFRSRYPRVDLDESCTTAHDQRVLTAGAAFAHIDLALAIVRRQSPALATLVARYLLIDDRPTQAIYAIPAALAAQDPIVLAFERWLRDHLAEPLRLSRAAQHIGVSERTLQRATSAALGFSPVEFAQEVRLDHAMFLLRTTQMSTELIANAVGYQSASTLRGLIKRRRGVGVADLR